MTYSHIYNQFNTSDAILLQNSHLDKLIHNQLWIHVVHKKVSASNSTNNIPPLLLPWHVRHPNIHCLISSKSHQPGILPLDSLINSVLWQWEKLGDLQDSTDMPRTSWITLYTLIAFPKKKTFPLFVWSTVAEVKGISEQPCVFWRGMQTHRVYIHIYGAYTIHYGYI